MNPLKSQHGEGIGGPIQQVEDPNNPSFDPATRTTSTEKRIQYLLEPHTIHLLSDWERNFLMEVYGQAPLSRKVHLKVASIFKKHTQPEGESQ
jgi:hypothetical protein